MNETSRRRAKRTRMGQHGLPESGGKETTEEFLEAQAVEILEEAENRLHAQKAVMVKLLEQ